MTVLTTRRFTFSAAHRYWRPEWSAERNLATFGKCTNLYGHGHNYELFVTVGGPVDALTGMVMNISDLKQIVGVVLDEFDHKHLNEDTPYFRDLIPTTEHIVQVLWQLIAPKLPPGIRLHTLRLYENADLYAEYTGAVTSFSRRYEFAAAHRLHAPSLSAAENRELYGKCNNLHGHGHNYQLEVSISGDVDPQTGMVIDLVAMDEQVAAILAEFDHHHLDQQVADFRDKPSTAEHILLVLWERLRGVFGAQLKHLRLWETANNVFDYPA